jgi:hypothetical protein
MRMKISPGLTVRIEVHRQVTLVTRNREVMRDATPLIRQDVDSQRADLTDPLVAVSR